MRTYTVIYVRTGKSMLSGCEYVLARCANEAYEKVDNDEYWVVAVIVGRHKLQ